MKKLVYEKHLGQDNPADLFTEWVGREKLQQFAWASGQTFLDGRAEKSLQVQGVCVLQLHTAQSESKMSELAHAEIKKILPTNAGRQRASRTIGVVQPSCIAPDRQRNPWSKHQGGVVGCGVGFAHGLEKGSACVVICRDESVSVSEKCSFMCE